MQMDLVDNSPAQDLPMQPANLTASPTLFLNFGGSSDNGQQYVTSLLECDSNEDVFKWGKENTGAQNATVQALNAIEAGSAGEYVSKTASSIGNVNYHLERHEHGIMVNEHREIKNDVAIGHMQEDIETERGNLRACQRFVVGHDEAIKRHDNDIKALQETVETLLKANEKLNEKNGKLQDEIEKLQRQLSFQHLVIR